MPELSQAEIDALKAFEQKYKDAQKLLEDKKKAEDAAAAAAAEAERKRKEDEAKNKGDWEQLMNEAKAQKAALAAERNQLLIDSEITKLSVTSKLKKDTYLKLLDRSQIKVEDGKVVGVDAAFEALKKENPEFFGEVDPNAPTGTGGSSKSPKSGIQLSDFAKTQAETTNKNRQSDIPKGFFER